MRASIEATLAAHAPVGAPATWVLSNHDVVRHVTRYGRADTSFSLDHRQLGVPTDLALGTRRARAAALLALALPGSVYVYQGDELGLWEVEDIPDENKQDQMWSRTNGEDPGRDGCRVPLPWSGKEPPFGFSPEGATAEPWLPDQPEAWSRMTVQAQTGDPNSMLELYREALRLRRTEPGVRSDREQLLPELRDPAGEVALELGEGRLPLCRRRGVDQVADRLGLEQIHPAIENGAAGEFTGCGGTGAGGVERGEQPAGCVEPAVAGELHGVVAAEAVG